MSESPHRLDLPALDGANPLGFLAALGTLAILSETDPELRLGWKRGPRWGAFLESNQPLSETSVLSSLPGRLRARPNDSEEIAKLRALREDYEKALAELKTAQKQAKLDRLRDKNRREERKQKIAALQRQWSCRLEAYNAALENSAPSDELRAGKLSGCSPDHFRKLAGVAFKTCVLRSRRVADLIAAFGIEQPMDKKYVIQRTPFCFTTGSGHQEFIGDIRQLMTRKDPTKDEPDPPVCVNEPSVRKALFEPWLYSDPGLSMRWDPVEDRRYALLEQDPTTADNKPRTVWMANLLAYSALVFFPCAWDGRALATAAWSFYGRSPCFTWPLWESPLTTDTVRSLLRHPAFGAADLAPWRAELRARGVAAIFRCRRIEVGSGSNKKVNFTPAQAV